MVASIPGQTIGINVFNDELIVALGLTRSQVALAYFIGTALSGTLIFWVGKVYDILGSRVFVVGASFSLGVSLLYLSAVDWIPVNLSAVLGLETVPKWMLVTSLTVGFFLIRVTGQGFVAMAARNMVAKWWKYHRGKVLPFSGIGVSVCFSLSPTVFYDLIQSTDWRTAWQILGLATGVGFALYGWLVFRDNPQECGLSVDAGIWPGESQKDDPEFSVVKDLTRGEAVRTFSFWVFTGIFSLQALQITAYVFHVLDLGKQLGLTPDIVLGLFFPSALIGGGISVLVGWLSDRFRLKYFAALMASGIGLSSFSLLTRIDGLLIPMLVAGLSIANGCFVPISGAFAARYFGIKHIGAISGVFMSTMIVGSSVGPLLFSLVRDFTGSYIPAFGGTFTVSICFVVASFWANNPQRKMKAEMEKGVD
tara:strand:+ start:652 stop:1917 length:1266 start_codon:yes stop_codon:yes gene_type:complete